MSIKGLKAYLENLFVKRALCVALHHMTLQRLPSWRILEGESQQASEATARSLVHPDLFATKHRLDMRTWKPPI